MSLTLANRSLRFVFIIITIIICGYFFFAKDLLVTIEHSPLVNASIIGVQIIGVLYSLFVSLSLALAIRDWRRFSQRSISDEAPARLRGATKMLESRVSDLIHSNNEVRNALLQSFKESLTRKVTGAEYISGLLVGLGLLGTFIGLIMTMGSIKAAIGVMSSGDSEISALLDGLAAPLGGMSAAFTASLLGLLGSLVMGLIAHMLSTASDHLYSDVDGWVHTHLANTEPAYSSGECALTDGRVGIASQGVPTGIGQNYEIERLLRAILKFTEVQQAQQHESVSYLNKLLHSQEKLFESQQTIAESQRRALESLENNHQQTMNAVDAHNLRVIELLQGAVNQQQGIVTALQSTNQRLSANGELLEQSLIVQERGTDGLKNVHYELSELNQCAGKQSEKLSEQNATLDEINHAMGHMRQVLVEQSGHLNANRIQVSGTFEQVADSLKGLHVEMQGGRQQLLTLESVLRAGSGDAESIVQAVRSQNGALLECVSQITEAGVSVSSASRALIEECRKALHAEKAETAHAKPLHVDEPA
ncbi:MotA/TolQ/ExbB proton channel family protein [Leminorella grimontii]|uniref:MotA/TolQ/ExbB proton channel family protein n=1 Tax=Leminorella grimontii TaxID=82981 RepID=UPI00322035B3